MERAPRLWVPALIALTGIGVGTVIAQLFWARDHAAFDDWAVSAISIAIGVLAALVALTYHLGRVNKFRALEMSRVNASLRAEVDKRHQVERELRDAHDELQGLMNSVSDYLWSGDIDADGRVSYRYYSSVVEQMTGRPPEFYLPGPDRWLSTVHPDDRSRIEASVARIIADTPETATVEYRVVRPDGETRWVRDSVRITQLANGHKRIDGVVTDVTERRRLEQRVRSTQKLESLGILAGGVAHDFNNLLVGILGNTQLALMRVESDEETRALLQEVEQAAERAAELTKQLLAYSGGGRFVAQLVDLNELVQETVGLVRRRIPPAVNVYIHLADDLPSLMADSTQLRQVVMNLTINAAEAIGEGGGDISIRTGVVAATAEYLAQTYVDDGLVAGEYAYLEVADTGRGMTPATVARIFDPFFTTKRDGRGLGMAAVLGHVRGHKGAIRIETDPGHGTTFTVLLPVSAGAETVAPPAGDVAAAAPTTGTVLVIEDDESVVAVVKRTLESVGFEVETAADGVAGLERFRAHRDRISGVVLDLMMPRKGGAEVFHEIRKIDVAVPVVICSSDAQRSAGAQLARDRRAVFLQKPFGPAVLLERLRSVMASNPD